MKISVIIPIHNLSDSILTCLNSIYAQEFNKSEYEILVIFDSCTDDSEAIVKQWHQNHQDVNLTYRFSDCQNPGGARNVGLDNACGEYIMFIDGDDHLINNSAMSLLYDAVQGHNAVRVMDHEVGGTTLKFSQRLTIWLHFFSRELIGDDRFTDMLLNEDFEFVKRIRNKAGYNETTINTPLYYYNYDNERMVKRIDNVLAMSRDRKEQGLPPLFISDEFEPEGPVDIARIARIVADRNKSYG